MAERKINQKALRNNGRKAKRVKGKQEAYRPQISVPRKTYNGVRSNTAMAKYVRNAVKEMRKQLDKSNKKKSVKKKSVVQEWYRYERRAYSSYKSKMKKKGIILPEAPDLVKNPTMSDIQEMLTFQEIVHDTYKNREKASEFRAVVDRVYGLIKDGLMGSEFEAYKANKVFELVDHEASKAKETNDFTVIKMWKNRLPDFENVVNQFIFDSNETDRQSKTGRGAKSVACWTALVSCVTGVSKQLYNMYNENNIWE